MHHQQIETLAVHGGREAEAGDNGLAPAIRPATTFLRGSDGEYPGGHQYSRGSNETRTRLERALGALEGGEAVVFASGMAAVNAVFAQLAPGDHAIVCADAYHGVLRFVKNWVVSRGIGVTFCETTDAGTISAQLQPETRLVWIESPSNPELKIADLAGIATLARERGILTACDATLASPALQRTLDHGIDIAMHSSTKFIGGHSDLLGGVLATRDTNLAARLRGWQCDAGAVPSPFDCWLLLRSLPTLPLRVTRQSEAARRIAEWLSEQNAIERVFYPGLAAHPGHAIAARQMRAFGGVVSVLVRGGERDARAVASSTRVFAEATSLGGVESLIEHRASVEGAEQRSPANLLRLSIGLEHPDDLIADLAQALKR